MTSTLQTKPFTLTLISMPWSIFNRPSLQLAVLKAYLERELPIRVNLWHPYLQVAKALGLDTYRRIAESNWAGEALFAALLFPTRRQQAAKVFRESMKDHFAGRAIPDFEKLVALLEVTCNDWLSTRPFQDSDLVGFSVCFSQLCSSLYVAARLKEDNSNYPIVFGGSSCAGRIGASLLRNFSQIDFVVDGEGEKPLLGLCSFLTGMTATLPERIFSRQQTATSPAPEITDLNLLPTPDYTSYFAEVGRHFPAQPFIPVLPLEFSRGCPWNKCTFCNLNIQWQGYRWKKADKMTAELKHLLTTHQCLDFTFADNALPAPEAEIFFRRQADSSLDCHFFAEIRTTTAAKKLAEYHQGGLRTVQVGIESFSTSLLKKMVKGCTAIENIALLKHCAAQGIRLEGNLILEFPGSSKEEVEETMAALDFVLPFAPLSPASFFLGHGSVVHGNPRRFGIKTITPHRRNHLLFPPELLGDLELLTVDYRGDNRHQQHLWQPVRKKMGVWRKFHRERTKSHRPPLSYRDGGTFLIIRQEQIDGPPLQHRLRGLSRQIYLFCGQIRTMAELSQRFNMFTPTTLENFLTELFDKRLLFRENNQFIALAIGNRLPPE